MSTDKEKLRDCCEKCAVSLHISVNCFDCSCHANSRLLENWEKDIRSILCEQNADFEWRVEEFKSFLSLEVEKVRKESKAKINSLLSHSLQDKIKKIKGMKVEGEFEPYTNERYLQDSYNKCIEDIIKILQSNEE